MKCKKPKKPIVFKLIWLKRNLLLREKNCRSQGTFFTCLLRLLAGLLSSGQSSIAKIAPQFRTRTERSSLSVCNLDFKRRKESGLNDLIWSETLQTTQKMFFERFVKQTIFPVLLSVLEKLN